MDRKENTQYVLSYSYGKDSGACIHVIKDILHLPLDRIVTADVWATKDIPAVLPEMWEWQHKADRIILERYGIPVEHFCATKRTGREKLTYEDIFYRELSPNSKTYQKFASGGWRKDIIRGFPQVKGNWCNSELKKTALRVGTDGVQNISMIYGFPHNFGGWCKRFKQDYYEQELKRSFRRCPKNRGQT